MNEKLFYCSALCACVSGYLLNKAVPEPPATALVGALFFWLAGFCAGRMRPEKEDRK